MTNQEIMQLTGEGVFVLLLLILLLKPIAYYLKKPKILIIRRYLGWLTGLSGCAHLLYWLVYYLDSWKFFLTTISQVWALLGFGAFASLFLLSLISNDWSVKWLKTKWKKIQVYGIHILVILGLIHAHLAIRGYDQTIWLWVVPLITLLIWRIKAKSLRSLMLASGAIVLSLLIVSGSINVVDVVTEDHLEIPIDDSVTYVDGYWGNPLPTTWTDEDFELCDGDEPANLDTTYIVYCRNGDKHEK